MEAMIIGQAGLPRSQAEASSLRIVRQCRRICLMNLYVTRTYERIRRKLLSEDARKEMEASIAARPDGFRRFISRDRRDSEIALGRFGPGQARRHSHDLLVASRPEGNLHADGLRQGGLRRSDGS